jgi:hypothetical protein
MTAFRFELQEVQIVESCKRDESFLNVHAVSVESMFGLVCLSVSVTAIG